MKGRGDFGTCRESYLKLVQVLCRDGQITDETRKGGDPTYTCPRIVHQGKEIENEDKVVEPSTVNTSVVYDKPVHKMYIT